MMCKLIGGMDNRGHYDVEIKVWMQKGGNLIRKLKVRMDKRGHYDVQIMRWMQKVAL